ncbi:hypothetical protein COLO4_36778 [Corchorus olitorius]|uniref:Uncharacterized protein n=1 Tax=Corchorus olitorius TaxID=93759 RepID=A0A1R3G5E0_9ROSI|nr:hypothetical protein COLO4_36778 [Corchorus olitorius]
MMAALTEKVTGRTFNTSSPKPATTGKAIVELSSFDSNEEKSEADKEFEEEKRSKEESDEYIEARSKDSADKDQNGMEKSLSSNGNDSKSSSSASTKGSPDDEMQHDT